MRGVALFHGLALLGLVLLGPVAGCSSPRPATEMIIEVDGDEGIRTRTARVRLLVYSRPAMSEPFSTEAIHDSLHAVPVADPRWGPIAVLFPEGRDPLRGYRMVAIALDSSGDEITRTSLISGYVESVSLRFRLYLETACEDVECNLESTCRGGVCVAAYLDPRSFLDGGTMDSGPRDGGEHDGGAPDAPLGCDDCNDGMACTTDRCVDDECVHEVACDDGIECTQDRCSATGACENEPMDSLCTDGSACEVGTCNVVMERCEYAGDDDLCDDSNPCTANVCGGSGCIFPALTGATCADAEFCDGVETCDAAGMCQPFVGTLCPGASTCDEATDRCTGCVLDADCPGDSTTYGACDYADICDQSATRVATTTMYTCTAGICQMSTSTASDPCTRTTTGMSCPGSSCGPYTCGGFDTTCDSSGTNTRTCVDYVCGAGTCGPNAPRTENGTTCTRPTEGLTCGGAPICGTGYCTYLTSCSTNGTGLHDCNTSRCRSDTCTTEPYTEPDSIDCSRPTEGMPCGACGTCSVGLCSSPVCDGGFDSGVFDGGTDAGPEAGMDGGRGDAGRTSEGGTSGYSSLSINEIDYDQPGADTAEFVEIYNRGPGPVSLTGLAVVLVRGNTSPGVEYARATLSGVLGPGGFAVITPTGSTMVPGPPTLFFTFTSVNIRDGLDGVLLWDVNSRVVVDALSYEGSITDANILAPGDAMGISLVEGLATFVTDNGIGSGSMCRRPDGDDSNNASGDWDPCMPPSFGGSNL